MRKAEPRGVILEGRLVPFQGQVSLEACASLPDEDWVLSPAFVNAHSHLEYRGMLGRAPEGSLGAFLRFVGEAKARETAEEVIAACKTAAFENRKSGVWLIWEHSDRLGARQAMDEAGLTGVIFQEVITLFAPPEEALRRASDKAELQMARVNPHAVYTVDEATLAELSKLEGPLSIHAAESEEERSFFTTNAGPMADRWREMGRALPSPGLTPVQWLERVGFLREGRQVVHACAISDEDIRLLAGSGASVAHCPRSNRTLGCPPCPVRRLLDAGVQVGLGMDSPASGGPIDMFAEMRAALSESERLGAPLLPEEVWRMACEGGASALAHGQTPPWIGIRTRGKNTGEVLSNASPEDVFWVGDCT